MADQGLAQGNTLRRRLGQAPIPARVLARKLLKVWQIGLCWMRYFIFGVDRGVPGLADFVVGNRVFPAWQIPSELAALGEILVNQQIECSLELGTALGGTLFFLARLASPRAIIVSVDLPGGPFGGGYGRVCAWIYRRFARPEQRLKLLRGDSHATEMLNQVTAAIGGQLLDFLFIDGDHSYDGVKRDFVLYTPLVRRGGIIALHDIVHGAPENVGGVPEFWREIKSQYRHKEFVKDWQQGGYGIGVLYVE